MVQLSTLLYTITTFIALDAYALPGGGYAHSGRPAAKAVYFQTNKVPNSIAAIPVGRDGTLSGGTMTLTGGNGGDTVDAKTGKPNGPDSLSTQGSVVVAGNYLFNVNAGSNTISMFFISPINPTKLYRISTANTNGDFPVTLAVSGNKICAGNTGANAGISCASWGLLGIGHFDTLRKFNLNQTNPPTGPFNAVADTFFSADGSSLVTSVKGDPTVANNKGFLSIFPVTRRGVSSTGTTVSPTGTLALFGGVPIPGTSKIFITDASFGSLTLDLANPGTPLATTKIADQAASCWAEISPATGTGFITDVAVNHIVNVDLTSGAIIEDFNSTNGNSGMIDFVAPGSLIYALSPGNGSSPSTVAVFDVAGGIKDVQNFAVAGADQNSQGMAFLLA